MKKTILFFLIVMSLCIAYMFYSVAYQPLWHDGPYVHFSAQKDTAFVRQYCDDSQKIEEIIDTVKVRSSKIRFKNPCTQEAYKIDTLMSIDTLIYEKVNKVLALGESTSDKDLLVNYLINNKIIDKNKHWIWKKNHLVLLGNLLHRGDKVADYLWLIYRLEQEAQKAGGRVHYLLGKNELQTLDLFRNKTQKHLLGAGRQRIIQADSTLHYEYFFGLNTFFGQWLRSKNSVVKINNHLFVHGGIAPQLLKNELSIQRINDQMRATLSQNDQRNNVLYSPYNPINFNRYVRGADQAETIAQLPEVLDFYAAKTMVTAGMNVVSIQGSKSKKMFAIKVQAKPKDSKMEGLLIEKQGARYKRLLFDAKKEKVNYSDNFGKK